MHIKKCVFRIILSLVVLTVLVTAFTAGSRERGQFMFLDEIEPAMTGICKTVIQGTDISTFDFRVVDVIRDPKELYNYILAKASGEIITKIGGIAGGMSGSPCYIDGKLVGALFATYVGAGVHKEITLVESEPNFLIQPIESMLEVIDACRQRAGALVAVNPSFASLLPHSGQEIAVSSRTGQIRRIKFVTKPPSFEEFQSNTGTLLIQKMASPLMVNGLSERTFNWVKGGLDKQVIEENLTALLPIKGEKVLNLFPRTLGRGLEARYNLNLYRLGGIGQSQAGADSAKLEPGGALGAPLTLGDILFHSYGTVTYIEDQCLVAFGHSFLEHGETELPMTSVYILDVINTVSDVYKLGTIGGEIGAIIEDRYQAIGGALGTEARMIQADFRVLDRDTGRSKEFKVRLPILPDLYPDLAFYTAYDALFQTLNRIGQGTAKMRLSIEGTRMRTLQREDIFVSQFDVAVYPSLQLWQIALLLAWNEFIDPKINKINLEIEVEKAIRAFPIEVVEASKSGRDIQYTVKLYSYRQEPMSINGTLTIPDGVQDTIVKIWAAPLRWLYWKFQTYEYYWDRPYVMLNDPSILSIEDLLKAIEEAPANDAMLVWAYSPDFGVLAEEIKALDMAGLVTGANYSEYMSF